VSTRATDEQFLQRALDLAREGVGLASPNPYVGAVIVDSHGNVAGTGTYTYDGVKHAEILALEQAGDRARGGTLYINLEPHAHQGRTPPCTDALISAGIHRVVASMTDPNPKVSGQGFEKLSIAGVVVEVGGLEEQARKLNEPFARYIRHGIPFVTLKSAMTLDGKIAPAPLETSRVRKAAGEFSGHWITGEAARAHAHELRHQHDAILCGLATILKDNPLLTDRSGRPRRRPLLRVILDSRLRLPLESRLAQSVAAARENDVVVFCSQTDEAKRNQLEQIGIRVEQVPADGKQQWPDIRAVLRRLAEWEITSVIIEGGATVNWSALSANVVDKIFFYYAPKISRQMGSVPFAAEVGSQEVRELLQVQRLQLHRFGEDFAVEGYLRDPYGD
jgi:diaminohydroxyphosphoribosylaminopyrimidine deaminase / 5-amino-6-(5-phosphoribosylamino)uracil reductase